MKQYIEVEAQRNVELMWLTGRVRPDFKTIANFHEGNGRAIRYVAANPTRSGAPSSFDSACLRAFVPNRSRLRPLGHSVGPAPNQVCAHRNSGCDWKLALDSPGVSEHRARSRSPRTARARSSVALTRIGAALRGATDSAARCRAASSFGVMAPPRSALRSTALGGGRLILREMPRWQRERVAPERVA